MARPFRAPLLLPRLQPLRQDRRARIELADHRRAVADRVGRREILQLRAAGRAGYNRAEIVEGVEREHVALAADCVAELCFAIPARTIR